MNFLLALSTFTVATTLTSSLSFSIQVCPTPQPCHCVGPSQGSTVVCSFLRLDAVPYFLDFEPDVWIELDLSENLLESLPADGLHGVRVQRVRLDRNVIHFIDDAAFRGIGQEVDTIDLSHNRLTDIRLTAIFSSLRQLRVLRLRYNHLARIMTSLEGNIDVLPALVELDLTGNDLDRVPSESLTSLPALRRIYLRDNRIQHVGEGAFVGASLLEMIDLGANRVGTPASGTSLHGSRHMTIDSRAFCGLEPRAFSRQPAVTDWTGLQSLKLDHNGLTGFDTCSLVTIWTLVDLQLIGNPLNCDCRLLVGLRRLTDPDVGFRLDSSSSGVAQCATPEALAGWTLRDAVDSEYCNDVINSRAAPCHRPCSATQMLLTSSKTSAATSSVSGCDRLVVQQQQATIYIYLSSFLCMALRFLYKRYY